MAAPFLVLVSALATATPASPEIDATHGGAGLRPALADHEPLGPMIRDASDEFGVPEVLLQALVWEASRWDASLASAWAGYGPLDLREDRDPSLEAAARLLGADPDDLIADPRENIRGGAALLADQARRANGGALPDADDLESWWPAVKVFSGSHDEKFQAFFASYVYELVFYGVNDSSRIGEEVRFGGIPVDLPALTGRDYPAPLPATTDYSGAYQYLQACDYSDYSRTGADIEYVIIHTVQGSYSGCISWFQNCSSNVSAHYVVRSSDGQVTQMVREADVGWHAGNWTYNEQSIGIEHEGYVEDPSKWYTDAMYKGSAALVADIVARTDVEADRTSIIGHVEVPGATHTDPGTGWDWDYYMSLVTGGGAMAGKLTGVVAAEDIYSGERLVGASVRLVETGETTVTNDLGSYTFEDLAPGTYTVVASATGYDDGTCAKEVTDSSTFWCSIALLPAEPVDTDTPPDTDVPADTDTGTPPEDTDEPVQDVEGAGGPGGRMLQSEAETGCRGCDAGGTALGFGWLPLALLAWRRRR